MDDDGTLGIQNWGGYYRAPPLKGNLGLQLMPNMAERETKPFFSGGGGGGGGGGVSGGGSYLQRECGVSQPSTIPMMSFTRDSWYHGNRDSGKMLHVFQGNQHQHSHHFGAFLPETTAVAAAMTATGTQTFQMLQQVEPPRDEKALCTEGPGAPESDAVISKKRAKNQGPPSKASKPKKNKKPKMPREEPANPSGRRRSAKKSMDMVINGIDLDFSGMPTPVCTCTGQPQQCYKWGAGGWQSACCTTSISEYPLPMSTKRRGARIAGRKMSQGAFKKVLEKLAGEGQDFSSPIDLKPFWAKHGTNKFVTIRGSSHHEKVVPAAIVGICLLQTKAWLGLG
ncbi:hypothetical protein HPP92_009297 [Vanilla planifolia]|uniref:GAGA-binding transcriptional activator n=1 Tax=Vanilla planifolia TaxID=51239 RepID=A0A835RAQ8_VANPL|nr:hypothetical protein HPP92_009508 [Vanilla planifolia]KAG0487202.1 hypothetical protein HPP92_009297 [Vanilla planifolia]